MKILTIFIDMLRSEQVYTSEAGWKSSILQEFFLKMGGVLFSSCYTPAPDSYRSFACFWQSQYPFQNGCNCRTMKTYDYLKNPKGTFLSKLKEAGYGFNCFVGGWNNDKIGFLPAVYDCSEDNLSTGCFLPDYLKTLKCEDNSFTFINLEDLHFYIEDEHADREAFLHGTQKVVELMELITQNIEIDEFDDIIFFSDHGFRYYWENEKHLLDKRRSNIFCFWHQKGEKALQVDDNLRSIMDIYPTLLNKCNIAFVQEDIEGKDLFLTNGHNFLLLEEHSGYYSGFLDPICQWAVVNNKKQFYFMDEKLIWEGEGDFTNLDFYERQLSEKMTNYGELKKQMNLQHEYKPMKTTVNMVDFYSDGKSRVKRSITFLERIKRHLYSARRRGKNS